MDHKKRFDKKKDNRWSNDNRRKGNWGKENHRSSRNDRGSNDYSDWDESGNSGNSNFGERKHTHGERNSRWVNKDNRPARQSGFSTDKDTRKEYPKKKGDKFRGKGRFERDNEKPGSRSFRDKKDYEEKYSNKHGYSDAKDDFYTKKTKPQKRKSEDDGIRLNKFIANSGACSRREADEFITAGAVKVNGKVVTELGTKVKTTDEVHFDGQIIRPEKKVYILLNKPKDYVTTVEDPNAKHTVMELIRNACEERVYPVGRLDRNSTGVLLFTNDGELTKRLTHPKYMKRKIYHVYLDRNVTKNDLQQLVDGVDLEDGMSQADAASYPDENDKTQVGIEIHSGKNRIIRRMFEELGYKVIKLDRVYFAGLTKKNLPRGKWRFLTQKEINLLKMNAFG